VTVALKTLLSPIQNFPSLAGKRIGYEQPISRIRAIVAVFYLPVFDAATENLIADTRTACQGAQKERRVTIERSGERALE